ncbi:MAG: hypothetical protein [Olavius algarvensis Gamma 1 endosymbiont]|nr:MAG: hypothetical protein [Olavius algarvensis Gamma 1 endosymbiont]
MSAPPPAFDWPRGGRARRSDYVAAGCLAPPPALPAREARSARRVVRGRRRRERLAEVAKGP